MEKRNGDAGRKDEDDAAAAARAGAARLAIAEAVGDTELGEIEIDLGARGAAGRVDETAAARIDATVAATRTAIESEPQVAVLAAQRPAIRQLQLAAGAGGVAECPF